MVIIIILFGYYYYYYGLIHETSNYGNYLRCDEKSTIGKVKRCFV